MIVEYSTNIIAAFLRNLDDVSLVERADLSRAVVHLADDDKRFLSFVVRGYSLRESGRLAGCPDHTHRRYHRICRQLSKFLNGGAS